MFRLHRALVLLAAGASLFGAAACGGDGSEAPSVPATKPKEPAAPQKKPLAVASYEHGLKWWRAVQQPAGKTRIRVVRAPGDRGDPRRPRGRVMQAKLKRGDVTVTGDYSASRAEVYGRIATRQTDPHDWPDGEGSTRWYGFDLYVPRNFCTATDTKWMTITQWKGLNGGSPPVALEVRRSNLVLNNRQAGHPSLGALTPGRWTRVVIGMHLTPDPKTGWITALRDGRRIVQRMKGPTMDTYYKDGKQVVDPVYLKQGIYRAAAWRCSQTLYFGPITIGDSLGAVQR